MLESATPLAIFAITTHILAFIALILVYRREFGNLSKFKDWNVLKKFLFCMCVCFLPMLALSFTGCLQCTGVENTCDQLPLSLEDNSIVTTWLIVINVYFMSVCVYIFSLNLLYRAEMLLMILRGSRLKTYLDIWKAWTLMLLLTVCIVYSIYVLNFHSLRDSVLDAELEANRNALLWATKVVAALTVITYVPLDIWANYSMYWTK